MTDLLKPLTPADCDLRDFPFMPLDVVRLRDSDLTAMETAEAFRAAVMLWCASWHQLPAASLPDDNRVLANLAGYGRVVKEFEKERDGALRGWVRCSDGRLYHPVVAEKAMIAWQAKQVRMRKMNRRLEIESGEWEKLRTECFKRDDYTCRYCGERGGNLEADHSIPHRHGGPTVLENLVTACRSCNRSKGSKPLEAWLQ